MQASLWKKDASLAIKARFKAAQLLLKQLLAGWQFAKNSNHFSKSCRFSSNGSSNRRQIPAVSDGPQARGVLRERGVQLAIP